MVQATYAPQNIRFERLSTFVVGTILVASGCFHVLVWLLDGGSLNGAVSWRKPILFGLSAGVTVLSLGWVAGKLRRSKLDGFVLSAFSLAMLIEVGLITLQQWRGVASHFNSSTPFDAAVLNWIEWLIVFATIVIAELTRRSFRPLPVARDMSIAIRGGMVLLLLSCLLGFVLVGYGNYQASQGLAPDVYGAAGVMKFPHGVPMHAIQYLPLLAWLLSVVGVVEIRRVWAVALALAGTCVFTAFSLLQTFSGRSRFELTSLSALLLTVSVGLLFAAFVAAVPPVMRTFSRLSANVPGSSSSK